MGFRFRRRAKLFPGVYLNFSSKGISTTIGGRGASININSRGTYLNAGIPGTGLSYREKIGGGKVPRSSENPPPQPKPTPALPGADKIIIPSVPTQFEFENAIASESAERITSPGLNGVKETLLDAYKERAELSIEVVKVKSEKKTAEIIYIVSLILLVGIFVKWFKNNRDEKRDYLREIEEQLANCFVGVDIQLDAPIQRAFEALKTDYEAMCQSQLIWDITASQEQDRAVTRSAASTVVSRRPVKFGFGSLNIINSDFKPLKWENANGGDLYFYPGFIVITGSNQRFGLIDYRDLKLSFTAQRFIETQKVPSDSKIIDKTWAKVNKNGTPDKRFKDNYEIPIVRYGELSLISSSGLNEAYAFSNYECSERFAQSLHRYNQILQQLPQNQSLSN